MTAQLIKYEAARQALEEAALVDEAKSIRDKALALQAYARQAKDGAMIEWATEIRMRAERKVGILLKAMAENHERGGRGGGDRKSSTREVLPKLNDLGVSRMQSHRWQRLAELSFDEFERRIEATKYDIRRAADGVEREPKKRARSAEEPTSKSIFDDIRLKSRGALGDLRWSQLDRLISEAIFELELLKMIRDAGAPPDRNARLREIVTESAASEYVTRALEKSK